MQKLVIKKTTKSFFVNLLA